MKKIRVDRLMVEREMVPSRQRAVALIMAGCVFSGSERIQKPGQAVDPEIPLEIKGEDHPYVGRGGVKLAHALEVFSIDVAGMTCMDVGASTGGFTDCLLKSGAKRIYAIDVGYGQLAWKLANDGRVVVIERTNIRNLGREAIPEPVNLAVIDVSFISLDKVLPKVDSFVIPGGMIVALIKPQFEVGRELVGKGGIVRDSSSHELAVDKVKDVGLDLGWFVKGVVDSPITGAMGNREFLIHFIK